MKNIFTLFAAFAVALLLTFFVWQSPPVSAANSAETDSVSVFDIGNSTSDVQFAVQFAAQGSPVVFVAEIADGDGRAQKAAQIPLVANKHGIIPITTAAEILRPPKERQNEPLPRADYKPERAFYDLPPNDVGYRGECKTNRTRDQSA